MLLAQGSLQQLQQRPWLGRVSYSFSHLHLWVLIKEAIMIRILLACVLSLHALNANAADPSCTSQATEKKLAGAAKTSFMNKCQRDAKATCEAPAREKKLAGAAKTTFTNKCVKDAVGG